MRKKCLGCDKIFEDKLSICQDCLNTIESIRSQFEVFPKGFRKKTYLSLRKFLFWIAILNVFVLFAFILKLEHAVFLIITGPKDNIIFYMLALVIPLITAFVFGFYLGILSNRFGVGRLVKMWSDKEWYLVPVRSWRYTKYWLPAIAPFFIIGVTLFAISYILRTIVLSSKPESIYLLLFYIGLGFGLRIFSGSFLIGWSLDCYFTTDWMQKLSK